uniref:Uncharacterized protein n=1 Tax=Anguilla anguilla TaxID=7936 RepID=A0A0E9RID6_ANGAN
MSDRDNLTLLVNTSLLTINL